MTDRDPLDTGTGEPTDGGDGESAGPPENSIGWTVGRAISWPLRAVFGMLYWLVMGVLSRMPKRKAVYRKMIEAGYENLEQNTSGHFVVNTIYGDGAMVPRPATIDTDEQKVETSNGEFWTATSGVETVRIGKTPVAFGVADQHEMVDHIQARITEALDYSPRRKQVVDEQPEGYRPVEFENPLDASQSTTAQPAGAPTEDAPEPRADGGFSRQEFEALAEDRAYQLLDELLPRQSTFADVWVDARNPEPENDGWIVSMKKAYEAHWDQAASEEMQKQEDRGRLAEMDPSKHRRRQLVIALVAIACFCLGLFGPGLAAKIAGTAGGAAGGGGLPLALGALVGVV